jgi:hypothetical protein
VNKHRRPRARGLRRSGVVLGLTAAVVVAGAGSAAAYWKTTGTGTGSAGTGTLTGVVFTTTGTVSGLLYPTGTFDLALSVNRNATTSFTIKSMTHGTIVSSDPTNCPASSITVANNVPLNQLVSNGPGSVNFTVPSVVSMISTAPSQCQGVTFTVPMTLTGVVS